MFVVHHLQFHQINQFYLLKEESKYISQQSLPLRPSNATQSNEGETPITGNFSIQGVKNITDLSSVNSSLPTTTTTTNPGGNPTHKSRLPIKVYSLPMANSVISSNGKATYKVSPNGDQTVANVNVVEMENSCHSSVSQSVTDTLDSVESHFAPELADFHKALVSDVKAVNI